MNNFYKNNIQFVIVFLFLIFSNTNANGFEASSLSKESFQKFIDNWTQLSYRSFTDKEGLPQNTIKAIEFDSYGYLWIGTSNGLALYDGVSFNNILLSTLINKQTNNAISYIHNSKNNILWVVNEGGNVFIRKDNIWKEINIPYQFPNDTIKYITEEKDENNSWTYYISTKKQVFILKNENYKRIYTVNKHKTSETIEQVLSQTNIDGKTILFLRLTDHSICFYKNNGWEFITMPISKDLKIYYMHIGTIPKDNSELIISTNYGVFSYNISKKVWAKILDQKDMENAYPKYIWKTYKKDGTILLWLFDFDNEKLIKYTPDLKHIYNIGNNVYSSDILNIISKTSNDITTDLWIGTQTSGLLQIRNNLWHELSLNKKIPNLNPSSIIGSVNNLKQPILWIGTYGNGLIKIENDTAKIFNKKNGFCGNYVLQIIESYDETTKEKIIWAATNEALAKIVNDKTVCYTNSKTNFYENEFRALLESTNNNGEKTLWIGTERKLLKLTNNNLETIEEVNNNQELKIHNIVETKNNNKSTLWLGTTNGLLKYENNKITKTYNDKTGLPSNNIYSLLLHADKNGKKELWVGTQGYGIAIANVDDLNIDKPKWEIISQNNFPKFPDNTIYSMVQDGEHRTYIFTNKGAIRLDSSPYSANLDNIKSYTFNQHDGLPSNEFNLNASYYSKNGYILAGTTKGTAFYNLNDEVLQKSNNTPFHLLSFIVQKGKDITIKQDNLSYKENNLKFDFKLLNFYKEMDIKYSYKLDGLENNYSSWSNQSKKEFTTLPEGSYKFTVWAKDFDGSIVGPMEKSFKINPAPWKTKTAIITYISITVASIWSFMKWRLNKNLIRQKELENKIEERTKELSKSNKKLQDIILELDEKNNELLQKNIEINTAYTEVVKSREESSKMFSALAEALPGTLLDQKYQLEEVIGMGGFSVVYKSKDIRLDRYVAVKIFKPQTTNNINNYNLENFIKEGASICKINHQNAVLVLDTGITDNGVAYLVMEMLEGETLFKRMERQKIFSIEETFEIIKPVCDVLSSTHKAGMVHRDIKPENIFIHKPANNKKSIIKVLDFGIAKEIFDNRFAPKMTESKSLVGTPFYMAPERLMGLTSDEKVDVYAVAIVMYEMLSGLTPFTKQANAMGELIIQHLNEKTIPLYFRNSLVAKEFSDAIEEALSKDPILRPSINEFSQKIEFLYNMNHTLKQKKEGNKEIIVVDINPRQETIDFIYEGFTEKIYHKENVATEVNEKPNEKIEQITVKT